MAILLGTAEVLASLKKELKGTVKFIFQPRRRCPEEKKEAQH
jgi:amidohydrolase